MRALLTALFLILIISFASAECSEGQIDINSASLEELDKLSGIGPVYAQRIIDGRTYTSVDELIDVNGIGEVTLEKIKSQGLACVSGTGEDEDNNEEEDGETNDSSQEIIDNIPEIQAEEPSNEEETIKEIIPVTSETILLTPKKQAKDIKTNSNVLTSDNLAIYGLFGFCILLGILFGIRKIKSRKTEFNNEDERRQAKNQGIDDS